MPRANIALFIALSQFIGTLGPMLAAGSLTSSIIEWRVIFFSMAVFGIVIAALRLLFVEKSQ
ncbi:major facilitator superfamily (MFS) transporter [Legionella sainthelensi]|uniref:hypothetical protein n=1 Tax=Legionella sainthelensi TaxID=28087 RepID=UPI000F6F577F|nr:hypothetical protein [Legionella sainthelensi]VEB35733.1 major facilitator superfamily (MFS) transporter [Legionella sainthelensi]